MMIPYQLTSIQASCSNAFVTSCVQDVLQFIKGVTPNKAITQKKTTTSGHLFSHNDSIFKITKKYV